LDKGTAMNPTLILLMNRKSVRGYSNRPVSAEVKDTILQAAMRAPTAGNMMLYTILEVEDQALKDRLAVTCDDQPFIAKAPYVLLLLADYQRWSDYYLAGGVEQACQKRGLPVRRPGVGDLLLACCDALIAAQTAVIAAEALGLGSCYIGDILERYEIHRELFGLPQFVLPVTLICIGYPVEDQSARKLTPRFAKEFIVHRNTYRHLTPSDLEQMMRPRNEVLSATFPRPDGIENAGQFNYFKKFSSEFSVEMARSVRTMIAGWSLE
jgi:nitroreductase